MYNLATYIDNWEYLIAYFVAPRKKYIKETIDELSCVNICQFITRGEEIANPVDASVGLFNAF